MQVAEAPVGLHLAYERRRRSVPSNLVAGAFGFGERRLFEIEDAAVARTVEVGS